ncbi:hypothetical protein DV737_g2338, partial [Chaetothyriales sp. CBS 132003]
MASSKASALPPLTPVESVSNTPMQDIEPSPVDGDDDDGPTLPRHKDDLPAFSQSSFTHFLGLTPSRTMRMLSAIQKYSVLPPCLYLTMHYSNTALIPLFTQSLAESEKQLLLTRPYYQSFPLEQLLVFAPIASHVFSGIVLRLYRRRRNAKRYGAYTYNDRKRIPWPKVSLTSALGFALYPMLAAHVISCRITPLKVEGGSSGVGLRYFAHGIAKHPIVANTAYVTMLSVASWHFVTGAAKYLKLSREYIADGGDFGRIKKRRRDWIINGVAAAIAVATIFTSSPIPTHFASLYSHLISTPQFSTPQSQTRLSQCLRDLLLKQVTLVGAPQMLTALIPFAKASTPPGTTVSSAAASSLISSQYLVTDAAAIKSRGEAAINTIYGPLLSSIVGTFGIHSADIIHMELFTVYGLYLSDYTLMSPLETELVVFVTILSTGLRGPSLWHARGLGRMLGARGKDESTEQMVKVKDIVQQVKLAARAVVEWCGPEYVAKSKMDKGGWPDVGDVVRELGGWGDDDP